MSKKFSTLLGGIAEEGASEYPLITRHSGHIMAYVMSLTISGLSTTMNRGSADEVYVTKRQGTSRPGAIVRSKLHANPRWVAGI
jgi:hypothetical protein